MEQLDTQRNEESANPAHNSKDQRHIIELFREDDEFERLNVEPLAKEESKDEEEKITFDIDDT